MSGSPAYMSRASHHPRSRNDEKLRPAKTPRPAACFPVWHPPAPQIGILIRIDRNHIFTVVERKRFLLKAEDRLECDAERVRQREHGVIPMIDLRHNGEEDVLEYYEGDLLHYSTAQEERKIRKACVVMPTYNEAKTIGKVLSLLTYYASLPRYDSIDLHMLVVDDKSPDGTADIVSRYREQDDHIHLLIREKKEGLGAAYIDGMQRAMQSLNPEIIVEMDADLQHNPIDVFRLIEAIGEDADFVIGSRYVNGGQIPENWGIHRKLTSVMSNLAMRALLNPGGIRDCTGGFRAMKTELLRRVDLKNLGSKGYAFQAVLLDAALRNGGKVKEIPITFGDRAGGESKMRIKDIVEGGTFLLKMRMGRMLNGKAKRSPESERSEG